MPIQPDQSVHAEIQALEAELLKKRASLETSSAEDLKPDHEKEVLRETVKEKISEHTPTNLSDEVEDDDEEVDSSVSSGDKTEEEVPLYKKPEMRQKVQDLVSHAFSDGIQSAVKKAVSTDDPALIDAFHDVLVDELYDYLVEQDKIRSLKDK